MRKWWSSFFSTIWHMPGRLWTGMLAAAAPPFWAQLGAAVTMTLVFVGFGLVIWKGPWPQDRAEQQLDLLGYGMMIAGVLILVAMVRITDLSVGISATRQGFSAKLGRNDDDEDPPSPPTVLESTTRVTVPADGSAPVVETDHRREPGT